MEIDICAADFDSNPLFRASSIAHIRPYAFAAQVGRLSEERSLQLLAKSYAEGVIVGSPSPGFTDFTIPQWEQWLLGNPEKFATIRAIAEVKRNFDPNAETPPNAQSASGPTAGSGS